MDFSRHLTCLLFFAFALPRSAVAAVPRGEEGCHALLTDLGLACKARDQAKAELAKTADSSRRAELQTKIAQLGTPFAEWCDAGDFGAAGCNQLATLLEASVSRLVDQPPSPAVRDQIDAGAQRAAQPDRRTATNKSGSVAQVEPVEAIQPISLAGGAISLAGTRTGTMGVATVTINPLALTGTGSPVKWRMFDIGVTAPFNLDGSVKDTRFVGIRARLNATAPWSSDALVSALDSYYKEAGRFADALETLLKDAPDVSDCAKAILKSKAVGADTCGQTLEQAKLETLRKESYAKLASAQREADRYYLGVDFRLDLGDPTGDAVVGDDGTRIQAAVAGGIRIPRGKRWDVELRFHAGGDYFRARDVVNGMRIEPVFSVDWGGAALLSGHATDDTDKQRMSFGIGVSGRSSKKSMSADMIPTNFVDLRLMVIVPATSGADMGLAFTIPLDDTAQPRGGLVTVSTDLGLLDGTSSAQAKQ